MRNKIVIIICLFLIIGSALVMKNFYSSTAKETNSNTSDNTSTNAISNNQQTQTSPSSQFNKNAVSLPALDFKLKDLDGKEVTLKDLKGKKVFLNFWATWCPPCRGEMPEIEKVFEESKNSDLVIIAVNLGEDNATVKAFMEQNNYKFKVLLDSDRSVASQYEISAVPTSFFINKNGKIINKNVGAMSYDDMEANIKALDNN